MANGTLKVSNIQTSSGSGTITLGQSGETLSVPSGATLDMSNATTTLNSSMKNTPAFYATMSGNQSYSSSGAVQKVSFDSEYWDTASAYDASSNYRFSPQTAGKYLVYGCVYAATFANESMSGGAVYIKKNGSNYQGVAGNNTHNTPEFQTVGTPFSIAVEMNGSSDYIECYVQITFSSGTCNIRHDNNGKASFWGANKLIGA